jgi:hypothetical protein
MVLTSFTLLMPAFALVSAPTDLADLPSPQTRRSPTSTVETVIPSFGGWFEPRYIIRATAFDQ